MKVFLDTNVVVSAFATRGLCGDLFHAILAEHEMVLGGTVLGAVRRVMVEKFRIPRDAMEEIETFLRRQAAVVAAEPSARVIGLDPADARVVDEAAAATVDVLVTGDKEVLELADLPVPVVSPRGLWELLRSET